jgi:hypothetical protein
MMGHPRGKQAGKARPASTGCPAILVAVVVEQLAGDGPVAADRCRTGSAGRRWAMMPEDSAQ